MAWSATLTLIAVGTCTPLVMMGFPGCVGLVGHVGVAHGFLQVGTAAERQGFPSQRSTWLIVKVPA